MTRKFVVPGGPATLHDLVECMFLRDPDSHLIEIITDPPAFHPRSSTNV